MTRFVGTPLRGIEFSSPSDEAVSARVASDAQPRIRIDAGGRITWTSGANASGQVELYRDSDDLLLTPDVFKAASGLVTLTTSGAPTAALPDGAIAIDTTNNVFYFRSNGSWSQVTGGGGGGASLTVSDTAPESPEEGDLWYDSTNGNTYVYYDSFWIQQSSLSNDFSSLTLNGLTDVDASSPADGQFLKYASASAVWVPAAIPTINNLDDIGDVNASSPSDGQFLKYVSASAAWVPAAIPTINNLDDVGDVTITSAASGQFLKWNGTAWVNDAIDLATDTVGNYVSNVTGGTGVTVTHTPGEGSSPQVSIGQSVDTSASVQFYSVETTTDLTVGGNLTVNGTTTTVNTTELLVEDNIITLNNGAISPSNNAGIEVNRGMIDFKPAIRWNEMFDRWEFTNDGMTYTPVSGNIMSSSSNAALITMDIGV